MSNAQQPICRDCGKSYEYGYYKEPMCFECMTEYAVCVGCGILVGKTGHSYGECDSCRGFNDKQNVQLAEDILKGRLHNGEICI